MLLIAEIAIGVVLGLAIYHHTDEVWRALLGMASLVGGLYAVTLAYAWLWEITETRLMPGKPWFAIAVQTTWEAILLVGLVGWICQLVMRGVRFWRTSRKRK